MDGCAVHGPDDRRTEKKSIPSKSIPSIALEIVSSVVLALALVSVSVLVPASVSVSGNGAATGFFLMGAEDTTETGDVTEDNITTGTGDVTEDNITTETGDATEGDVTTEGDGGGDVTMEGDGGGDVTTTESDGGSDVTAAQIIAFVYVCSHIILEKQSLKRPRIS
jgi:hypothetical protein